MDDKVDKSERQDWERLILAYLDGSLPEAEAPRVSELLAQPNFQLLLANHAIDQTLLHEMVHHHDVDSSDGVLTPARSEASINWRGSMRGWMSLAALVMLSATVLLMGRGQWRRVAEAPQGSVRIDRIIGAVDVEDQPAKIGDSVTEEQRVSTRGLASFAILSYTDGTELQLSGDTVVACGVSGGRKRVRVLEGHVSASVAPQAPDRPLIIQTNTASMEVVGTDLAVSAADAETRLNVASGSVKMRRQRDGEEVLVAKGQFAVAALNRALSARPSIRAPQEWSADFVKDPSKDWPVGRLLPPTESSRIRAVATEFSKEHRVWTVQSRCDWSEGLFRIEDDTHLNYRIKMDRPQWYQILLCVRDDYFRAPNGQPYHEYQELIDFGQIKPGEWRTLSVPLSAFRLTQRTVGDNFADRPKVPPPPGATAFLFQFSTQLEDRGLAVDRVWVTRGRPKELAMAGEPALVSSSSRER